MAPWHDDVLALAPVLDSLNGEKLTGYEPGIQYLAKLGVMEITPSDYPGEEGRNWVVLRPVAAQWFTWSALQQSYKKIENLASKVEALEARLA